MDRDGTEGKAVMGMYGIKDLKQNKKADGEEVPCPVEGCETIVPRMRQRGSNLNSKNSDLKDFYCINHGIYVSPSTFKYDICERNIVWPCDMRALRDLKAVKGGKRTKSRMDRENDEDSLSWNVFFFLHKSNLLPDMLAGLEIVAPRERIERTLFWSVDIGAFVVPLEFRRARKALGESECNGSEPDLVAVTENSVTIIEVKVNAPAKTKPPDRGIPKGYQVYLDNHGKGLLSMDFHDSVSLIVLNCPGSCYWVMPCAKSMQRPEQGSFSSQRK